MFLALRDLRFAKGRFVLMGSVVALISLMVVMLAGLTAGLGRQSVSAITSLPGDRVAFSQPAQGQKVSYSESRIPAAALTTADTQPGVQDGQPLGITNGQLHVAGRDVGVAFFGADPGTFLAPKGLNPGTAVISDDLAAAQHLRVGDTITAGAAALRVSAIRANSSYNHTPVVWVPRSTWVDLPGANPNGSVLVLKAGSGFDASAFDKAVSVHSEPIKGSVGAVGSYTAENGSLTLMRVLLMAISALVVGAFFTVWTIQRTPDLAVLKAIGAKTGYLLKDSLSQALVLLLAGGGIGALAATGLGLVARQAVPFVVDTSTTLTPLLMLVAVGMVGAAAALRRVTTVDPITALGAAR